MSFQICDEKGFHNVYHASELSKIVNDTIKYYEDVNASLRNEVRKNKEEIFNKIKAQFQERIDLSYGEFNSKKELSEFIQFNKSHGSNCSKKKKHDLMIMTTEPGFIFQPFYAGVGTYTKITCPYCGESTEIVDYDAW